MTPDQGIGRVGVIEKPRALRLPETRAVPEPSPFPDGTRLWYRGADAGWSIRNDGLCITLTQDPESSKDPFGLENYMNYMAETLPVYGDIYTFTPPSREKPFAVCTLPTVTLQNAVNEALLGDLPTAGIKLVQTRDRDKTPVDSYVNHLFNLELVASGGQERYLHDLISHGPGAVTTHGRDFDAFRALVQQSDQIGDKYGNAVQKSYRTRLGHAFDSHSSTIMAFVMDSEGSLERATLPYDCLEIMNIDSPKIVALPKRVIKQSEQIINEIDTPDNPLQRTVMKNNSSSRTPYYDEIRSRMRQRPYLLNTIS